MNLTELSDAALQVEIGARLRHARLQANISQEELAVAVGISRRTVANAEKGAGCTLQTLLAILRGLGRIEAIEALLPTPVHSPVQLLRDGGTHRQRARRKNSNPEDDVSGWKWGDDTNISLR